jgi:hypothetical protein
VTDEEKPTPIGEFLRFQDVSDYFKYDNNPSNNEALIEMETASKLRGVKTFNIVLIIVAMMFLVGGAIAYNMISGTYQSSQCESKLLTCISGSPKIVTQTSTATQGAGIGIT